MFYYQPTAGDTFSAPRKTAKELKSRQKTSARASNPSEAAPEAAPRRVLSASEKDLIF